MLTDKQIREKIEDGEIVIKNLEDIDSQIGPVGIDLRVGPDYIPSNKSGDSNVVIDARERVDEVLQLQPGKFYNIHTIEKIHLPNDVVGFIDSRSTLERSGIGLRTGGNVDPGFEGVLEFGIYNYRDEVVSIETGYPIAQLSFIQLDEPVSTKYGERDSDKYHNQSGVRGSEL